MKILSSLEDGLDFARLHMRSVLILGMVGCDPCKSLKALIEGHPTLTHNVSLAYVELRPSHARIAMQILNLTGVPTALAFEAGQLLNGDDFPPQPMPPAAAITAISRWIATSMTDPASVD